MSSFAKILAERVEGYIALRRSLGYTFRKQATTLRALVRYVEARHLDGPLTRKLALGFVMSWPGTANGRAVRHGVVRRFCEYLAIYVQARVCVPEKRFASTAPMSISAPEFCTSGKPSSARIVWFRSMRPRWQSCASTHHTVMRHSQRRRMRRFSSAPAATGCLRLGWHRHSAPPASLLASTAANSTAARSAASFRSPASCRLAS